MRFYEWYPSVSADDGIVAAEFGNGIVAATDETLDATGWTPLPRPTDNMDEPRRGTTIVGGRSLYAWTGPSLSALGLTIADDNRIAPARYVPIGVAQSETNSAVRLASVR